MSGKIFISYRRDDSAAWAGRLSDRLKNHFPSNQIFMDIDAIDPGVDFVEAVEAVVGACDVLIAVIGSRWLASSDRRGKRRLDIAEDLVRLEIGTALKRGIRLVPVLVEGAMMPESGELPDDLKALVRRNALEIGHIRFDADSEHLVKAVERALGKAREQREAKENERLAAEQRERRDREQSERVAAEIRERQENEQLDARRREQERSDQAEEPFAETPKVVYPLPPVPEKPPPSGGTAGGKSPSKQLIALSALAAVLIASGLIYLAIRQSQSPSPPPAPISAITPNPAGTAAPTQVAAAKPSVQPRATVIVSIPSPSASATSVASGYDPVVAPPLPVVIGDSLEKVKAALGTSVEAKPYSNSDRDENKLELALRDRGLIIFFDSNHKVYTIRFQAPFAGSVGGVRIGDTRTSVVSRLGLPLRSWDEDRSVYYQGTVSIEYGSDNTVQTMFRSR
jgi:TIR domain